MISVIYAKNNNEIEILDIFDSAMFSAAELLLLSCEYESVIEDSSRDFMDFDDIEEAIEFFESEGLKIININEMQ